jgi:hypothetical protein
VQWRGTGVRHADDGMSGASSIQRLGPPLIGRRRERNVLDGLLKNALTERIALVFGTRELGDMR